MPALVPPPAPDKPTVASIAPPPAKPVDKPTQIDAPSGNEPTMESYLGDDMAELSAMESDSRDQVQEPKRGPDGKFQKPVEQPKKPLEKPKEEKVEPQPEPEKPADEPKPGTMRALGKAYDEKVKLINHELQPQIQSLKAKNQDYERQIQELRTQQPDLKPLQSEIENLRKERQQLLEVVRFADYRKSPEFVEKYEKPYNEAWTKAVSEVTQLSIQMEDGTARKATANDLLALANAPLDQLDDLAAQWFPKSSPRVIRHVEKIRELAESQDKALSEAQKGAGDYFTKQSQAAQEANQTFTKAFTGATAEITQKYPKWFGTDEADPQGNEILKKGFDFADAVFSPNSHLSPQQKAGRLAVVRAKAANHDRLVARLKARDARIAELEADLAKFEQSEPPTDDAGSPSEISGPRNWEADDLAELRKLER